MSDEPKKWPQAWIVWTTTALVAYVVSIGPAYRFAGETALQHPAYATLMATSRNVPIGQAIVWYLNQWPNSEGFVEYGKRVNGEGGTILFFKGR
jgi:hypothetical protein